MLDKIIYGAKIALPADDFGAAWANPIDGMAIGIKDNKIVKIAAQNEVLEIGAKEIVKLDGGIVAPGFIDTQVNGGGGVLFNDAPNEETILQILNAHKKFGTTAILPTLISDDLEKTTLAINAVKKAIQNGESGILGIHLEGPFISPLKKGIHDESKFKILDNESIEILSALEIAPTLITIAPERHDIKDIEKLANKPWTILAAGHTNATSEDMMKANEIGLCGLTHLYNAMSQISAREPGVVGYALEKRNLICGLIVDMVHVHPQNIRLAFDVLGACNLMLVTDAMNPVGTDDDCFMLYGKKIFVRDGSCFDDNGTLAGSALDMASAVRNSHFKVGIPLGQCLQMASETPARFLNLHDKIGSIRIGNNADLIHLDDELYFQNAI